MVFEQKPEPWFSNKTLSNVFFVSHGFRTKMSAILFEQTISCQQFTLPANGFLP
jgi:hypothetical protein